jgi:hypothetical protein
LLDGAGDGLEAKLASTRLRALHPAIAPRSFPPDRAPERGDDVMGEEPESGEAT